MTLKQLIYSSLPFGYDDGILGSILLDARRCNNRDGVTGALVCRHDIFLQLLEGPADMVDAAYARIERDDRHANITVHLETETTTRMFGAWDMLHDPAKSMMWSIEDVAGGAVDRATPDDIKAVFTALSTKANAPATD